MATVSCQPETQPTVLVVDDEAGPRDALNVILHTFCNVRSAENAKTALEILGQEPIDLITLDQKLPDRHGLDLLRDIKHYRPDVEVIIVTGYGSLKAAMEGVRHGAAGYLLKPFNVNELTTLIQQTMDKKRRLDFLRRCLRTLPDLWGSEEESARAWDKVKAGYASLSVHSQSHDVLRQDEMTLLPLLSDALEATDRQLLTHSSRVSFYATLMASRLNLIVSEQKALALGAFLHDLGKTSFPSYRFSEDQVLPSGEASVCREHVDRGVRMIAPLGLPIEVRQVIASHHEQWDGHGYPRGLRGPDIPLLARIVGIAQTFDHLTADAPGRVALPQDVAIRQISLQSHTHFDPLLLELFVHVVKDSPVSPPAMDIAPAA
ncbi:HD domain-containing phosphohydrolase [Candidatus Nitrospira nitrificans]|uniref:Putative Response regulator with HD domain n=1 Tax=Candidatus Nitrospira nitrificans TaxID=1742973 RepID=A0A0S4LM21_9BACT|nr:HD domain-containing phosphohydrolase [Candidatus Nitrospira nitrificans]CUS37982.1 putative Response regulator with HD domain [Candidatus Nitrospira nitrificans]